MSNGRLAQAVVVERRGAPVTAAHDHAVAISGQTMTDAAENVVALVTAHHDFFSDWKRECDHVVGEIVVCRDCALRARGLLSCGCRGGGRTGRFCFLAGEELGV